MQSRLVALGVIALIAAGCSDDSAPQSAPHTADDSQVVVDPADVAAVASTGCGGAAASVAPGEEHVSVPSGGSERTVIRRVPPAHDAAAPIPVVIDFHGYSEGGDIHALHSALGPFGDEQGFVTITPDSGATVPRWDTEAGSADLTFFGDLLDEIEATLCVDTNRIFVTGLSNGAMMTSAIACEYSDRVAAVAPVAGIQDPAECDLERPVPVMAFHGTADEFLSYEGGLGPAALDLPAPDGSGETLDDLSVPEDIERGPSVPEVVDAWAERDGCELPAESTPIADDVALLSYACPAGVDVELYRVEGGGHTWPGSEFSASIESVVGPTTFSFIANEEMWAFFRAHPLAD
jgi:polyhydroxybutyrate depolymerase